MRFLRCFLLLILIFAGSVGPLRLYAQNKITGQLVNVRDTSALYGAVVVLRHFPDSTLTGAVADTAGHFEFADVQDGSYKMTIRYSSFVPEVRMLNVQGTSLELGVIPMFPDSTMLSTVVIKSNMIRIVQKNDTIEMNAAAFKTNPDATAEDLVAKMPGITVVNGEVKAQGETVQKVLVDGKEYFGDDASSVLKNMPADMVDKVQIFDQKSDQSLFTGVDDGNTKKTMNIVTKNQYSNATFGKIYAGYGTDNRYQAGFVINDFRQQQKFTILGNFNNINQVNFATQDLSSITGGGSRGSSGRGGGRGGDNTFMVGKQSGISSVNSFGLNYSNRWGTKTQVSGSYFFTNTSNTNNAFTQRTYYSPASGNFYRQDNVTGTDNLGHRASLRLEYTPDSVNSFVFSPRFNYQYTDYSNSLLAANYTATDSINKTSSRNASLNTSWNIGGSLNYRHRFAKAGRTMAVEFNGSYTDRTGSGDLLSRNTWYGTPDSIVVLNQSSSLSGLSWNVSPTLTWTEKAGKTGIVSFSYNPSYSLNTSQKQTLNFDSLASDYTIVDTTVSNSYNNYVLSHKAGINYRMSKKDANWQFGLDGMHTEISGETYFPDSLNTTASFNNLLPSASVQWKKGKKVSARVNYRTSTNVPSVSQLQQVVDNSNPLVLSSGNPYLKQSYSHSLFGRYSLTNADKATNLFLFVSGTVTTNYIGSSLLITENDTVVGNGVVLGRGGQYTRPVNMNGYYVISTYGVYSRPLMKLKSNMSLNWSYSMSAAPGLINSVKNIARSNTFGAGAMLTSNISPKIDFSLGWNGTFVMVNNSTSSETSNNYYYHVPTFRFNWMFGKGLVFTTDVNYTSYRGLGTGFNQDFILWNAAFAYKFAKDQQCEVRISAFDLLQQNNSLQRNISETYLEDVRTDVLQQYFMMTFTWNIKKFRPLGAQPEGKTQPAGTGGGGGGTGGGTGK